MNRFRITTTALIFASALTLSACAEEEPPVTAAPAPITPAATTSAPPAAPAGGTDDKELCQSAKKAADAMRKDLVAAITAGGDPSPAVFKKILTDMNEKMTTLSAQGDGEVASAMKAFGAQAEEAAKAADPADAAANPAFETAGADVTAACKPTGVNVNF